MSLNRRSFLQGALGASLVFALPSRTDGASAAGSRAEDEHTASLLREFILQRASSSTNPWMEMHVILALGADFSRDGKNVLEELVARIVAVETLDMRQYPYFPLDIERHPFHMLQIMQATGVPKERVFVTPKGRFTRDDFVQSATALFKPDELHDELSWAVSVLCNEFPPDRDQFTTARGEKVVVSDLVRRHLEETEKAFEDVFLVMKRKKLYDKGALHKTACNGTHLLYGLLEALRYGYRRDDLEARVERLIEATLFRARLEPLLIDRAVPGDDPMIRLNRDAANFTFVGHVIEMFGYNRANGVVQMSTGANQAVAEMRGRLAVLTDSVTTGYDIDALQEEVPQAYKLILGDACHAYRGIRYWT